MNGIIKFLLDKNDLRAHLLRKYFVFVIVPMLNPDGVANGHCRMDYLNQNLNLPPKINLTSDRIIFFPSLLLWSVGDLNCIHHFRLTDLPTELDLESIVLSNV